MWLVLTLPDERHGRLRSCHDPYGPDLDGRSRRRRATESSLGPVRLSQIGIERKLGISSRRRLDLSGTDGLECVRKSAGQLSVGGRDVGRVQECWAEHLPAKGEAKCHCACRWSSPRC